MEEVLVSTTRSQMEACKGAGCISRAALPWALDLAFFHLCLNIQPVQPVWAVQAGASKH